MRHTVTTAPSSSTLAIYLESYKQWLAEQAVSKNTQRAYRSRVKQFLLFREYVGLSDQPLNECIGTGEAINLYLKFLKQIKNSGRSLNATINAINNFSNFLGVKAGAIKREPCYFKALKILNVNEQSAFLLSAKRQPSARDKALAMVLIYTGMRVGDCARLEVSDVLLKQNNEHEDGSEREAFASIRIRSRHSQHESRIPLNSLTEITLSQWLKERQQLKAASSQEALWLTKEGLPLSISGITFVIKRIGWQANLAISAEILRRTCIVNAAEESKVDHVSEKLGSHVSASTIRRYASI